MYVIVRSDLAPGYQLPQSTHSAVSWIFKYPEESKSWHENSDYLIVLNIDNEAKLIELMEKAESLNIKSVGYREEDLDGQYTALCLEPGDVTKKLCRNLKLALSHFHT